MNTPNHNRIESPNDSQTVGTMGTTELNAMNEANANTPYPATILDEPEYQSALDTLLNRLAAAETDAYDRTAREYPRYSTPLLEAALLARSAEARLRQSDANAVLPESVTRAVNAGVAAARQTLNLPAEAITFSTIADARKERGWSLGELAKHLYLPNTLALKLERGQIAAWTGRLATAVAAAFALSREQAEEMLHATTGTFRVGAAAYSAQGDPDAEQVAKNRQAVTLFDKELEQVRAALTPEQAAYWFGDGTDNG